MAAMAWNEGTLASNDAAGKGSKTPTCAALKYAREYPIVALLAPCPFLSEGPAARLAWLTAHHGPNRVSRFFIERRREGLKDAVYCAYLERSPGSDIAAAASGAVAPASGDGDAPRDVLMWSRKWRQSTASQYVISSDFADLSLDRQRRGPGYMGKLKVRMVWPHLRGFTQEVRAGKSFKSSHSTQHHVGCS